VAKVRYDDANNLGMLYQANRNSRWHVFEFINPKTTSELLKEIEPDRTSIFWG
jgi:hypothetical protein